MYRNMKCYNTFLTMREEKKNLRSDVSRTSESRLSPVKFYQHDLVCLHEALNCKFLMTVDYFNAKKGIYYTDGVRYTKH